MGLAFILLATMATIIININRMEESLQWRQVNNGRVGSPRVPTP